jgi:hypothetical protein
MPAKQTIATPKPELSSLITENAAAGLALAGQIADQIAAQLEKVDDEAERPGGTTFLLPSSVPRNVIASVVFHTIATANLGWPSNPQTME